MTERLKAIPTTYKGIKFRSKLEAKYAKAFDSLNIPWLYEEFGFKFDDGTCYCPDFYFPNSKQYFEVKGLMTKEDAHKIFCLADEHEDVIVGHPTGKIEIFRRQELDNFYIDENGEKISIAFWIPNSDPTLEFYTRSYQGFLSKCKVCNSHIFLPLELSWECPVCGAHDGDHHLSCMHHNFFDAIDW